MSTGALFRDDMSETTGVGVSDWVILERVLTWWWRLVALWLWKPRSSSIGRCARYSTAASQWPSKQPAKWIHVASLLCWLLSPWRPPGQYGASSCPMAASSGFWWSPGHGHAASGDALRIAPVHCHGHRNGPRRRCIHSPQPPISIAVIIAKDHVMVH